MGTTSCRRPARSREQNNVGRRGRCIGDLAAAFLYFLAVHRRPQRGPRVRPMPSIYYFRTPLSQKPLLTGV